MNKIHAAAAAGCALSATLAFAGPFDDFKGKMKEGMYETKVEMDMGQIPGMPPEMAAKMGKQSFTHQHCVTPKDIEKGGMGKGRDGKGPNESCDVKDMKVSGNTATYRVECTNPKMTATNKVNFTGTGYVMDMDMAMDRGGQMMKMKQHMESKYLGPCK
jgi:hypothetical protein